MTATLLLRLCGPLQSWGTQSRFSHRDTGREPSKSGVIGLLCAALGKPRSPDTQPDLPSLSDLAALRMGVRVDAPGSFLVDFHTASNVRKAEGGLKPTVLSYRHYLCDASFLVGLEGDPTLLRRLEQSLERPVWPLALGRKSCVPSFPVRLPAEAPLGPGLTHLPLEPALESVALLAYPSRRASNPPIQLVLEHHGNSGETRQDVPIDFASRTFGSRLVHSLFKEPKEFPSCISPDLS